MKPAHFFLCRSLVIGIQTETVKTCQITPSAKVINQCDAEIRPSADIKKKVKRSHCNLRALAFLLSSSTGSAFVGGANLASLAFFLASSSAISDWLSPNLTGPKTINKLINK